MKTPNGTPHCGSPHLLAELTLYGHRPAGGIEGNDHQRIWDALDKVRAKSSYTGAARVAPRASPPAGPKIAKFRNSKPIGRSTARRALQALRPHAQALPIGTVVFPGSGISANLADKAKKLGIPRCGASTGTVPLRHPRGRQHAALSAFPLSHFPTVGVSCFREFPTNSRKPSLFRF